MKKFLNTAILLALVTTCTTVLAQPQKEEYLGLPGDNLNLYATMKLFQESQTLEDFERNLNDENSRINNLDLNGDNLIDYIKVIDYVDRDVHNIVLRVAINRNENQDVAVFTVQRFADGQVQIQLIGDEALYGKNYIIEPYVDGQYAGQTPNPGYSGNTYGNDSYVRTTTYEIAAWPVIRFMFMPGYVEWHSSWHWDYWPEYWHPWRPYYWDYYYGYHYNWYNDYYNHYRRCDYARYDHWNDFYYGHRRSYSPYVSERINSGRYNNTYSHPDQRRQGEALYARTNHDSDNRRSAQFSNNNTDRRSGYQSHDNRQSNGTSFNTYRRTADHASNTGTARMPEQNTNTSRRYEAPQITRSYAPQATTHNSGTDRRASGPAGNRPSNQQATAYNSFSDRRSAPTMNNHSATSRTPAFEAANSRPSSKPASNGESFSSRRNSSFSQPERASRNSSYSQPAKASRNNSFSQPEKASRNSSNSQPAKASRNSSNSQPARATRSSDNRRSAETDKSAHRR